MNEKSYSAHLIIRIPSLSLEAMWMASGIVQCATLLLGCCLNKVYCTPGEYGQQHLSSICKLMNLLLLYAWPAAAIYLYIELAEHHSNARLNFGLL